MSEAWTRDLIWNLAAYAALACLALVVALGLYLATPWMRRRLFPLPRLRPGAWTGHEVFLAFCTIRGFPVFITVLLFQIGFFRPLLGIEPDTEPPDASLGIYLARCGLIAGPLILTVALAVLFGILFARSHCRPHHYGVTWSRWQANVVIGLGAFVLVSPIVFGTFILAALILPERPHALVSIGNRIQYEWEWIFLAFQAVLVAPLLEEIVFRGILLGWLRRASLTGHIAVASMTVAVGYTGISYHDSRENVNVFDFGPIAFAVLLAGWYAFLLYRLARRFGLREEEIQAWRPEPDLVALETDAETPAREVSDEDKARFRQWRDANATLAIYGSAMLFAAFHSDAWPAPVPLFVMALVLGAIATRTQSLVGPIVYHALFNVVASIALYGSVAYAPARNGNAQTTPDRPSITTSVPASQLPLRK